MRALVLQDWWSLTVAEQPDPRVGAEDVLVRVLATGICGSDLHGFTGHNGRRRHGQVMGHETAGHVVELGAEVGGGLAVGDVVTINPVIGCHSCSRCAAGAPQLCEDKTVIGVTPRRAAAFAELIVAPAANLVPLPAGMPDEHGALVEPLAVGYHAVRRAPVRPGDAVLVIGGGPIGQACVLAARREGAGAVAVSEPDAHRRSLAASLGAVAVDPATGPLPPAAQRALGERPAVVVDAVGSGATLAAALASARPNGSVVLVGMAEPELAIPAYDVSTEERTIFGSFCYTPAEFRDTARWAGTAPDDLERLIEGRVDLSGGPDAFVRLARGDWTASKVLVFPNGLSVGAV
ncbi:zinc-dependent alcohol dehydrogenase [Jiangella asiatica]|uniref:Zinc-binding alcohol dehydrogenase n=1 Tax=Jiangella asiatica TaxID=2530372 RepID=A0A4R5DP31_9ACTN|nr:alcohol dehydrogenase catalytic domain-containing protein [Jiangella asiatica]TDE15989.1 zinc-binding alcohol dehydrogenase [Jiangella asiatica]